MATERKHQKLEKTIFPNLPQGVWCIIFSYLPKESRKNATSTCKLWFQIIRADSRFSGSISIPWSTLKSSNFDWDNWPSLKTLDITDSSFPSPKMALQAMKALNLNRCQILEKVTFGVNFDVAELSKEIISTTTNTTKTKISTVIIEENTITETETLSTTRKSVSKFMKDIGTVLALAFNPKLDIDLFKFEHLDKLEIHMRCLDEPEDFNLTLSPQNSDIIKRALKAMKTIGVAAKIIRWLIVGGQSFYYPEFFNTGFKNFGTSLKVLTLKNDCFENDYYDDEYDEDYVNSVHTFFKSMNENCPNLSNLNLGSAHRLRYGSDNIDVPFKKLSIAGFEMVKELNVDFTFYLEGLWALPNFNCFFGLINDCNNIETLSLNGLMHPFFEKLSGEMASIRKKFKNLKKCQISFREEFQDMFQDTCWDSCQVFASEFANSLDVTFSDRLTEFKVLIPANEMSERNVRIEGEKYFKIIKMPLKNSVITRFE